MQVSRKLALTVPIALLTALAVWGALGHAGGGAEPPQSASSENEPTDPNPQNATFKNSPDEREGQADRTPTADEPTQSAARATGVATGIVRVNEHKNVWIRLDKQDRLDPGTRVRVYSRGNDNSGEQASKAQVEIIRILEDGMVEARILSEDLARPIQPGDRVELQRDAADRKAAAKTAAEALRHVEALRQEVADLRNEIRKAQLDRDKQFETVVKLTDSLHESHRKLHAESAKFNDAMTELQKYRNEAGHLTIFNREEVHAIGVQVTGMAEWRWRVYLPASREFRLHLATGEVPKAGVPGPGEAIGAYTPLHRSGEFLILAKVEKNHRGTWVLAVSTPEGKLSNPLQNDAWAERGGWTVSEIKPGKNQSVAPGAAMVLLRLRVDQEGNAPETPCDGLMISIQEIKAE